MIKRLKHIDWKAIAYGVIGLIALAGVVTLMSFIHVKSSEQACTELKVVILGHESFIEQKDISDLITKEYGNVVGRTLSTLPIHDIERDLRQIPYVYAAVVNTDMDGRMIVQITQREAVVRVINNSGKDFYIDEKGLKMPVSLKYVPRVPVVNGHIYESYNEGLDSMHTPLMHDVFATAKFVSADSLWSNQVVQLYINQHKEIELVPRVGGQQIILGDASDLESKFEKLKIFYERIVPKSGIDAYAVVNLKYAGQIVCERSPGYKPELIKDQSPAVTDSLNRNNSNNIQ